MSLFHFSCLLLLVQLHIKYWTSFCSTVLTEPSIIAKNYVLQTNNRRGMLLLCLAYGFPKASGWQLLETASGSQWTLGLDPAELLL